MSIDNELGNFYSLFGDGYVPYNIIVGPGYQLYQTGAGYTDAATRAAIDQAMANFSFYANNVPGLTTVERNSYTESNLLDMFLNNTGNDIVFSVIEVSDASIISAEVSGNILTITSLGSMGTSNVRIQASAGSYEAVFNIPVEIHDPNLIENFYEDFESDWLPAGWTLKTAATGAGWILSPDQSVSGGFSACHGDSTGVQNDWIYTPKVKIESDTQLSFWQKGKDTDYYQHHGIAISYDLIRYTWVYYDLPVSDKWEHVYIDMSSYSGKELYIGFNYQGDYSDTWYVDDVKLLSTTGIEEHSFTADGVELFQNYPNPFNPSTSISFSVDKTSEVKLTVLNSKGEFVSELYSGKLNSGIHSYDFNAEDLNSGIYFYSLEYNGKKLVNKMLLIK